MWTVTAVVAWFAVAWRLTVIARGHDEWAVGDGGLIELYTLHALHGAQILGAYSQFGWHHPGPAMFYALAPFYAASHFSSFGLSIGALTINLAALATALWAVRKGRGTPALLVSVSVLLLFYAARVPSLLTSIWNPHLPMIPFVAALTAAAAALADVDACVPLVMGLSSFIAQAHVGFAPVAALLITVAFGALLCRAALHATPASGWWALLSVLIFCAMWVLPIGEQIGGAGNLTEIWRFFMSGGAPQPFDTAWRVWGSALVSAFSSGFVLALGGAYEMPASAASSILATLVVAGLVPAAIANARSGRRFDGVLASMCFVTSIAALWSVWHIREIVRDYQVFWLSLLGIADVAVLVASLASEFLRVDWTAWNRASVAASAAVVALVAVIGVGNHNQRVAASASLGGFESAARDLSLQTLHAMPVLGGQRPLLVIDSTAGAPAVGFVLQMVKRYPVPVKVDRDDAPLYGPRLAARGDEDLLVTISGADVHRDLISRPHNTVLANHGDQIFVDALSLVDEPQYRPSTAR